MKTSSSRRFMRNKNYKQSKGMTNFNNTLKTDGT